jgi:hypothetical protein
MLKIFCLIYLKHELVSRFLLKKCKTFNNKHFYSAFFANFHE